MGTRFPYYVLPFADILHLLNPSISYLTTFSRSQLFQSTLLFFLQTFRMSISITLPAEYGYVTSPPPPPPFQSIATKQQHNAGLAQTKTNKMNPATS